MVPVCGRGSGEGYCVPGAPGPGEGARGALG